MTSASIPPAGRAPAFSPWGFAGVLMLAVAFGALAAGGILLTRSGGRVAALWLPNALLAGVLLRRADGDGARVRLVACFLANLIANLAVGDLFGHALALATANAAEVATLVALMRRGAGATPRVDEVRTLGWLFASTPAAAALGAVIAAVALAPPGQLFAADVWFAWALADALSLLIVTPLVMIVIDAVRDGRRPTLRQTLEWTGWVVVAAVLTSLIFLQSRFPLLFMACPIVVVAAFRKGVLGAGAATAILTVVASGFTMAKMGPLMLVRGGWSDQLIALQLFLVVSFAMGLPVAATVEARGRLLRELKVSRDFARDTLDNVAEVIFRTDARGCWTYLNPAWERLTGRSIAESLGLPTTTLLHPEDWAEAGRVYPRIASGEIPECMLRQRFRHADGDIRHIEVSVRRMADENGAFVGTTGNIRDVSPRVRADAELNAALDRAEAAAAAKSAFLAHMSHEIRTPMNGVLGFTDLVLAGPLTDEQRRQMELIAESGRAMMRLLNDILDMSKLESGKLQLADEPVALRHELNSCVDLMAPLARAKDVALGVSIDPSVPPSVRGDSLRLRQLLLNLVGNAVKFTDDGEIRLTASVDGGELRIEIADTGIGIAPDRLSRIFEEFEQGDAAVANRYGGSGLGLAISHNLTALMGGRIEVASTLGEGSAFTIVLPLRTDTTGDAQPESADVAGQALPRPVRLLVAEDHDINQALIRALCAQIGVVPVIAGDGAEAVARVEQAVAEGLPYELVLMDIRMPVMGGLEATRRLRAAGHDAARLPIVALTANAYPEDVAACLAAGMQAHLAKPIDPQALRAAITRWSVGSSEPQPATADAAPAEPGPAPVNAVMNGLAEKFRERKREALAAAEAIDDSEAARAGLITMLHKIAGTAGFFGEAALGDQAAALERRLEEVADGERAALLDEVRNTLRAAL